MRSSLRLVLALFVLGSAGCSGLSTSGSPTYPNGYDESGITDPQTAIDQHVAALSDTENFTERTSLTSPKYGEDSTVTIRVDNADNRATAALLINRSGTVHRTRMYHSNNTSYCDFVGVESMPYNTTNESLSSFKASLVNSSGMVGWLGNISFDGSETVERDGETLYRYMATDINQPERFFYSSDFSTIDAVTSANSTLLVDQSGLIRSFEVTVTYTSDDRTKTGTTSYRVTAINATTVEKPDWIETAKKPGRPRTGG